MSVNCPNCGLTVHPSRYETQDERIEARRRSSRESARKRYAEYARLCAELEVPQRENWTRHLPKLRALVAENERSERDQTWREDTGRKLTRYHRFWLGKFTMDEIRVLGSGLLMFDVVAPDAPAVSGLLEQEVCAA